MSKLSIKQWAEEDRPREKLLLKGVSTLSDSELIAILIGSGNSEQSAVELAKSILREADNDLNKLARMSVTDLINGFRGIGEAKAVTITAALELGRRRKACEPVKRRKITSSRLAYEEFIPVLTDLNHEETWALLTDRSNKVITSIQVSRGGISGTVVDIRLILREALNYYASGIFLGHNHPSENCRPSPQDTQITKKLKEAARWMDIVLLDHIIVCGDNYFSFADEGII
ncbi:MAG: DNA repair protein RadC [Fermentimonas sp.]|nr:DNA repair protein RadC [Fermentimonas sp.]MDD3510803.1 DNA repair protein RadC [Fermentimonas sp.]MDD4284114.1 DNA repair protein RadC [Fermentimonas sp.]MDD4723506.1 DNA repair protein RadC [Fermentimonas sp.]NLC85710.1 DNA repair protein RadC [Bacteroidales bacterium]